MINMLEYIAINSEMGYEIISFWKKVGRFFKYKLFSEKYYVKRNFRRSHGYNIDLLNPQTFTEKQNWLKLYWRNDFQTLCADKLKAPQYIADNFGSEYTVPIVYSTQDYKQVKPENLPDFPVIIKSNHASGHYIIVRDKKHADWDEIRYKCRKWLDVDYSIFDNEWQYKNIQRYIIVEKLLFDSSGNIPNDYKVYCFNGKAEFVFVVKDRYKSGGERCYFDMQWNVLHFSVKGYTKNENIEKPRGLDEMIKIAEFVAKKFCYVRVDFYELEDKVFFGEITLYDNGGHDRFIPQELEKQYGDKITLPTIR